MAPRIAVIVVLGILSAFFCGAQAKTFVLQWAIPASINIDYGLWSSSQTFVIGDDIVFNFTTDHHSLLHVTADDYKACNTASPLEKWTVGPADIIIKENVSYFICGFEGHCPAGQSIKIVASGTPTSAPTPSPGDEANGFATGLSSSVALLTSVVALAATSLVL